LSGDSYGRFQDSGKATPDIPHFRAYKSVTGKLWDPYYYPAVTVGALYRPVCEKPATGNDHNPTVMLKNPVVISARLTIGMVCAIIRSGEGIYCIDDREMIVIYDIGIT
jgi:hypothetical protein